MACAWGTEPTNTPIRCGRFVAPAEPSHPPARGPEIDVVLGERCTGGTHMGVLVLCLGLSFPSRAINTSVGGDSEHRAT
jgi:hypothetical protein